MHGFLPQLFITLLVTRTAIAVSPTAWSEDVPTHDVAGSHDHPIISRFTGSVNVGYEQRNYDATTLPLKRYDGDKPSRFAASEYVGGKPLASPTWHQQAGARSRSTAISSRPCRRVDFRRAFVAWARKPATLGSPTGDIRALTARLARPTGSIDVVLMVSQSPYYPVGILLQIVEAKPMTTGQMSVNARALGKGLVQNGQVALYGIHFASDSAVLHGESNDTLAAKGMASYAPIASNHDDIGKARNRRVEMAAQ